MIPKLSQQSWIHGLPGYDIPGGVSVEAVDFTPPKLEPRSFLPTFLGRFLRLLRIDLGQRLGTPRLSVTIVAAPELSASLRKLSASKAVIPRLSLVVRTDPEKELDTEYQMASATIASILPAIEVPEALSLNFLCSSITARMGVNLNPGPPPGAPEIHSTSTNKGWIFEHRGAARQRALPVDVEDFVPPNYNGRLVVHFAAPSPEIQRLVRTHSLVPELVLVLPDRANQRYVEFKLWNARASMGGEAWQIAFESNAIEHLTG